MRKVIVSTMVTLDGVKENPHHWSFDYWSDEISQYAYTQLFAADALVMGRVTYEGFAEAWSARAGADEFADRMNSLPKYVASRTASRPLEWNASLIQGEAPAAIAQLKQQPGQDILQYGFGELTHAMIQHRLVDEIRLLVYPVAVGSGGRIFDGLEKTTLKLLETRHFNSGVVALHYQPNL
ncbi:MAG: dihydrofolate reductase family protein [Anaerolineae bacterium]|nr:dihydrofolate reductase family protein [Anaerolineae bacterium]